MKTFSTITGLVLAFLLFGCATQKRVATSEGRGAKQIYATSFNQTWRAAVDAAQQGDLEIISADRSNGYIAARRGVQAHTLGENVGIWVREIGMTQTGVEVLSRQAGPPVVWLKNWENEIQRAVAANLTREVPALGRAPRETIIERGDGTSTVIIPDSRARETIIVPDTSGRRATVAEQRRQIDALLSRQEVGQRALSAEVNETRRETLQSEMDQIRQDLRVQEQRLRDLERELK